MQASVDGFNIIPGVHQSIGGGIELILGQNPGIIGTPFDQTTMTLVNTSAPSSNEYTSVIYTQTDKSKSYAASAQVSGSGYGVTVSGMVTYTDQIETSNSETSYTLTFQMINDEYSLDLSSLKMTPESLNLLNTNVEEFITLYGAYYLSSYRTGCQVNAYVTLACQSESDMSTLSAELSESVKEGVYSASGSQSFQKTTKNSKVSSQTTGQAMVYGVQAPSNINPDNPQAIYDYKQYVAEHCTTGNVVSGSISSWLDVPDVSNSITNKTAIDKLSGLTITDTQFANYWNLIAQYNGLNLNLNQCKSDLRKCFKADFFLNTTERSSEINNLQSKLETDINALYSYGQSLSGQEQIVNDPNLLNNYNSKIIEYSTDFSTMQIDMEVLEFNYIKGETFSDGSPKHWTSNLPVNNINPSDDQLAIDNIYSDQKSNVDVYALMQMNYVTESSGQPWLVLSAYCLNGQYLHQCYNYNDLTASEGKTLTMKAPTCGSDFQIVTQFKNDVSYDKDSIGQSTGQACDSYVTNFIKDNHKINFNFCNFDYIPTYTDGTAPSCEGTCGNNWDCGHTKSGNSCWTGHKEKCVKKSNL
eukprot:Awhi_evm1s11309